MLIYVFNQNVERIDTIVKYNSVIWASRYSSRGDCELYLAATEKNIQTLRVGYYLARPDDDMVCRIEKIEVMTDAENGNYLTVTGRDVKTFLHQRIIWGTVAPGGGLVNDFIRGLVQSQIIQADNPDRKILKPNGDPLLTLGTDHSLPGTDYQQFSYQNLGEVIENYCATYGWGYRVVNNAGTLEFELYSGTDRSASVIFSYEMDNLVGSDYIDDHAEIKNVALVGGEGQGADKRLNSFGGAKGADRYEIYVNKDSMSSEITYGELKAAYPGGTDAPAGYVITNLNILIMDNAERAWLAENYPSGTEVTIDGEIYYHLNTALIATTSTLHPADKDKVQMTDLLYHIYLLNAGLEALAKYGEIITFNASIMPNVTFTYKEDYFLGDIVTIRDKFGNEAKARISEIIEVDDENGYRCDPKFTYTSFTPAPQLSEELITEDSVPLTTEAGDVLITEGS